MEEVKPKKARKPLATSPRCYKSPELQKRMGAKASAALKKCWADPEWVAALMAKRKAVMPTPGNLPRRYTRFGVPNGMRKDQAKRFWRQSKFEATLTVKKLEKAGILDDTDDMAKEALRYSLTVMRGPVNQPIGLAAAKQVLEWTKAKPATKQEVTLNKAEEWLAAITEDNAKTNEG